MEIIYVILGTVAGLIAGYFTAYFAANKVMAGKLSEADNRAAQIIKDAEKEAQNLKKEKLLDVKEEWHRKKREFDNETQNKLTKIQKYESQVKDREEAVEQKFDLIGRKEKQLGKFEEDLNKRQSAMDKRRNEIEAMHEDQLQKLEEIAGLTREDAKQRLVDTITDEAKTEAAVLVKQIKEEAKVTARREAKNIVIQAIQRTASDHSVESTVSVVSLESDDMKGRIIGREGRNIRAFEAATGIDLIIDDTPEAVVISGFDPFRREVAKMALEHLMIDGRIHPARIEEVVSKSKEELQEEIIRIGENAIMEVGIHGVHPELTRMIGKMRFRSSYGQNLLNHSKEVSFLCGIMAAELGLDPSIAKRAGLLHDIGKCVDNSVEGPHAMLGFELAKKFRENRVVTNAIGAHHEDIEMESPYAVLVQAADGISGARPGARRESLENYIKRLEKLESLAQGFQGVNKTFAIQAGREIRVIVEPEKVTDGDSDMMADDIAKKIEKEMEYPGQIKVTVIRERRSVALAK